MVRRVIGHWSLCTICDVDIDSKVGSLHLILNMYSSML
jgi:hypothetical protein